MKRALLVVLLLCASAFAQNFVTVTGSKIQNASGTALTAGDMTWQGVDCATGSVVKFRAGGGGQVITKPTAATVTRGAFSISLASPDFTAPANICYHVVVKDSDTGTTVLDYPKVALPANVGASYSFDNYVPSTVALKSGQSVDKLTVATLNFPDGTSLNTGVTGVDPSTNETITGVWQFARPLGVADPVAATDAVNKQWVQANGTGFPADAPPPIGNTTPNTVEATDATVRNMLFFGTGVDAPIYHAAAGRIATPAEFVAGKLISSDGSGISKVDAATIAGQTLAQFIKLSAKGDLLVGCGSGVYQVLPAGTNGQVVTYDSTQTCGVKAAAAGGGVVQLNALNDVQVSGQTDLQALVWSASLGRWINWTLQPASAWATITGKPTTILGFGITDGVANTVTVNGHALSANVTVTKGDVGLGSADNTADTAKPVSTAQQTALDLKANANATLNLTGNQTAAGVKTFSDGVTIGDGSAPFKATPKDQSTDPTAPAAGYTNFYSKAGQLCSQSPAGVVICGGVNTAPTITDFTSATHGHGGPTGGGLLSPQVALAGKVSGNADMVATAGATRTAGKQAQFDASGNLVASTYDVGTTGASGFVSVPANPSSTGTTGQYSADSNYAYLCYGTNSWIRVAKDGTWTGGYCSDPSFSPTGGTTYYNDTAVSLTSSTGGATICYTTDGSTPAATSPGTCSTGSTYSTPITVSANNTTIKALASKATYTNSNVVSSVYGLQVATPTASPAAGSYSGTQSVALSTTTTSGNIRYTTDGSSPACPSTGTAYSGAISVTASGTVKAIGCKANYADSGVLTSAYTITAPSTIAAISGQAQKCGAAGAGNADCALPGSVTSGNTLIVGIATYGADPTTGSFSCVNGRCGTFTKCGSSVAEGVPSHHMSVYSVPVTGSGAETVRYASVGDYPGLVVQEFSGVATSSACDVGLTATYDSSSVTSHPTASSGTLAQSNELAICVAADVSSSIGFNLSSPATLIDKNDGISSSLSLAMGYAVPSTTSSTSCTWTTSAQVGFSNLGIATFKHQ